MVWSAQCSAERCAERRGAEQRDVQRGAWCCGATCAEWRVNARLRGHTWLRAAWADSASKAELSFCFVVVDGQLLIRIAALSS